MGRRRGGPVRRAPAAPARRAAERAATVGGAFEPLVSCSGGPVVDELLPALALQVRIGRPQYLSRRDVPASTLAPIRDAAHAEARRDGWSEPAAARIAQGRAEQFVHETVLLEQVCVADPTVLVKDLLYGKGVRITGFARLDPERPTVPPGR